MTHVLIIISWLGGAVQGAAISTQEFTAQSVAMQPA